MHCIHYSLPSDSQPPDVTNNTNGSTPHPHGNDRLSRYTPSQPSIIRGQTSLDGG